MINADMIREMMVREHPILGRIFRGEPVTTEELLAFRAEIRASVAEAKTKEEAWYNRNAALEVKRIADRHPSISTVQWHSAGCADCSRFDGLEWMLNLEPLGHDVPLERVPPLTKRCAGILLPMDYFSLYFDEAIRDKRFDEADALIDGMRRDKGSDEWTRLKTEVEGRRSAHNAGQRFIRKKHLPEQFW